jgi:excisionase family DNA binding protein
MRGEQMKLKNSMPVGNSVPYDESVTYSVAELAKYWKVNEPTIYKMIRSGKLKAFKVGVGYRITDKAVREYEQGVGA